MKNKTSHAGWPSLVMIFAGGFTALLGIIVLIGWHAYSIKLFRLDPVFVAMVYNSALGLVLCSTGLMSIALGRPRFAIIAGLYAVVIGIITLVNHMLGVNMGIYQSPLMVHSATIQAHAPGQLDQNAALCFIFMGIALLFMSTLPRTKSRPMIVGVLGWMIIALGLVSLFGYIAKTSAAYWWAYFTHRAVHTAIAWILLGVGIILTAWRDSGMQWTFRKRNIAIQFGMSVVLLIVISLASYQNILNFIESDIQQEHSHAIIEKLESLSSGLKDAEVARRDYVITAEERFLDLYYQSIKSIGQLRVEIRMLLRGSPEERQRLDVLDSLIAKKIAVFKDSIEAMRANGFDAKTQSALSHKGRDVMNNIRALIGQLEIGEQDVLTERLAAKILRMQHMIVMVFSGAVLVLILVSLVFSLLNREIAERRRIEAELEKAKLAAEVATRAKSDFLANMSHELRTPLNAVIGFAEVLQDQLFGNLNEKQVVYVDNINASGKHLLSLINDILDLSKVESGKMELEAESLGLKGLLDSSLTLLKERAFKHNINLSLEVSPDADIQIEADPKRVKQIMFNLLSNAVKFTPDGGSVRVKARMPDADSVEISVEDMSKLFQTFSQIDTPYTKSIEGTGLGLALTKRLVGLHGGRIWASSEIGKGSTFTFAIPVHLPTSLTG